MKFLVTLLLIFSAPIFSKTKNCVLSVDSVDTMYIYCKAGAEKQERTSGRDEAEKLAYAISKANEYNYEILNCPNNKTCILKKIESQSAQDIESE